MCGTKTGKGEMVRVVRTPGKGVEVDATGRKPGRGAYLCRSEACWAGVLNKKSRLDRSLRGALSPEERLALQEFARQMAGASPPG
ncbi:MAG: hypothetical protein HW388_616 [Dehalococcoidia bacterium]|nr:hypothetical protein [Dehalococcoidia bacterium]